MPNPFTRPANPVTASEHQTHANWATYERMEAQDDLNEFDRMKIKAPAEVIARLHTARWVEKELIRVARQAHAKAKTAA